MTAQLKAEVLKVRSTRTSLGLVGGMLGLVVLFTLLAGLLPRRRTSAPRNDQRGLLAEGSFASVFSALAGIMLVTSEYRYGTIRPTFLVTPIRARVLGAKLAAGVFTGVVFGIVAEALCYCIGRICLAGRGLDYALSGGQTALLLLATVAATGLWGALGVGLGTLVRNQVGAIIALLAWGCVAENLLFGLVPDVGRFGPVHAQDGFIGLTEAHLLPAAAGALVLVAWTAAIAIAGIAVAARRDVD